MSGGNLWADRMRGITDGLHSSDLYATRESWADFFDPCRLAPLALTLGGRGNRSREVPAPAEPRARAGSLLGTRRGGSGPFGVQGPLGGPPRLRPTRRGASGPL